jgi:hypothetical protein
LNQNGHTPVSNIVLTAAGAVTSITTGASGPFLVELTGNNQTLNVIKIGGNSDGKQYISWGFKAPAPLHLYPTGYYSANIYWTQIVGTTGTMEWGFEGATSLSSTSLDVGWITGSSSIDASNGLKKLKKTFLLGSTSHILTTNEWSYIRVWGNVTPGTLTNDVYLLAVVLESFNPN